MFEAEKIVNQCVESLCSQGLHRRVTSRAGELPEVVGIYKLECQRVLEDPGSIMAAYNGRCEH
jgi:hypothetical protein